MKIIVLAGGLSPERDVSLTSGAGICKTLLENGHQAYLLDLYFGLENAPANLEDVFTLPGAGLEIAKNISTKEPDLEALKKSRPDQSDCMFGPNVIELCRMADITFVALHGSVGENGKLQAAFDLLGIKYTAYPTMGNLTNKAFISAVVGGLGSMPGAVVGALILGVLETMISAYVSSALRNLFAYALLIVILLIKPTGLMGKSMEDKA